MPSHACTKCGTPTTRADKRCAAHPRTRTQRADRGLAITRQTRLDVLERDGYRCYWCKRDLTDLEPRERQVDHYPIPYVNGGPSTPENLVAACGPCNRRRGKRPGPPR